MRSWWTWCLIATIVLSGTFLMTYHLDAREVGSGGDELLSIIRTDQANLSAVLAASSIRAIGTPTNAQPLHPLLMYPLWGLIGHSAFMLRFTSVFFGVCNLALAYKAGETLFGRRVGLLTALLLALFPLHLRLAQLYRFYMLLVTLSLLSLIFLWRALLTNRVRSWLGFVVSITLAVYAHYNALFVLLAEGLYTATIWVGRLSRGLRVPRDRRKDLIASLLLPMLAFAAVGLLLFPALVRLLGLPWMPTSGSGVDTAAMSVPVEWTAAYFRRLLWLSGLTTNWALGLFLVFGIVGLIYTLVRRQWRQLLLMLLWICTPFVVLSLVKTPDPLRARHVVFVIPPMLMLVSQGVIGVGWGLDRLQAHVTKRPVIGLGPLVAAMALVLAYVLLLPGYYSANSRKERQEPMIAFVERHAELGDILIVSRRMFLRPLNFESTLMLDYHPSPEELANLTAGYDRVWVMHTSFVPEPMQETVDTWVLNGDFLTFGVGNTSAVSYRDQRLTESQSILWDRVGFLEEVVGQQLILRRGHRTNAIRVLVTAYHELKQYAQEEGQTGLADHLAQKAIWAETLLER